MTKAEKLSLIQEHLSSSTQELLQVQFLVISNRIKFKEWKYRELKILTDFHKKANETIYSIVYDDE